MHLALAGWGLGPGDEVITTPYTFVSTATVILHSRIRDVDVASETSRMTSYQILQQAGVAMLAQANMTTGLAMSLLGG